MSNADQVEAQFVAATEAVTDASDIALIKELSSELQELSDNAAALLRALDLGNAEQTRIVRGLAAALIDNAWALGVMLQTAPARSHVTALTLWRPMYERWLRLAYFAYCATPGEIASFVASGELPQSPKPSRKSRDMSQREYGEAISKQLPPFSATLKQLADEYSSLWSGLIHGGWELVQLYDGHTGPGSKAHPGAVSALIYRTALVIGTSVGYAASHATPVSLKSAGLGLRCFDDVGTTLLDRCASHAMKMGFLNPPTSGSYGRNAP